MNVRIVGGVLLTFALTTAGILAGVAVPTAAQAASAVNYVALGDSYSAGVGAGPYDTSGCFRSQRGYPPLWATAKKASTFRFVACGGAVTADVLDNQLSALNANTTLVTITIGGNDAGFVEVVITCSLGGDSSCASAVGQSKAFVTNQLPARLDRVYSAIRSRAPSARVVVLGYPRLFELTASCGLLGMSRYKRTIINEAADALANVTSGRARAAGATFVDTRPAFAGHGVCASDSWVNGVTGLIAAFHPTATGYRSGYLPGLTAAVG